VTLPIDLANGLKMDPAEAKALGSLFTEEYNKADPFPHIVLDGILPDELVQKILADFPSSSRENGEKDQVFHIGYGGDHKRQVMPEDCARFSRELFLFFNSRPMLQFLEGLTGIDSLLPDPYFTGGGYHEITKGGRLGVHADFRINPQLHVQRRLNMLIYLNPEWNDDWKGQLELWSRDMKQCVQKVSPLLNRCVVFNTEADTWHGHPDPLEVPDGVSRKSIALYYYTASRLVYEETPRRSTMYVARPGDSARDRAEARMFRREEYLKDWLPPAAYRGWTKVRRALARKT
jgi:Rps23 Pro-64 3,4-dihydroxylase Tpa1-like proline 4-hydroxylase